MTEDLKNTCLFAISSLLFVVLLQHRRQSGDNSGHNGPATGGRLGDSEQYKWGADSAAAAEDLPENEGSAAEIQGVDRQQQAVSRFPWEPVAFGQKDVAATTTATTVAGESLPTDEVARDEDRPTLIPTSNENKERAFNATSSFTQTPGTSPSEHVELTHEQQQEQLKFLASMTFAGGGLRPPSCPCCQ